MLLMLVNILSNVTPKTDKNECHKKKKRGA